MTITWRRRHWVVFATLLLCQIVGSWVLIRAGAIEVSLTPAATISSLSTSISRDIASVAVVRLLWLRRMALKDIPAESALIFLRNMILHTH
jgi:hypothetical protein